MENNIVLSLYKRTQTVFSLKEISLLFPLISYNNLKRRLSYSVSVGKLIKLRRGVYAKESYNPYELAAKLYAPSYISLETVLEKEGIIFQKYKSIFVASYVSRALSVGGHEIIFRKLKEEILLNKEGVREEGNFSTATKERAFLDAIFLYKNYHFDNLKPLDWEKVIKLSDIYKNKTFEKRVESYYKLYKSEYVQPGSA